MPVKEKDLVHIDITSDMNATADYFSSKRILFEYPRQGYGTYNASHIEFIKTGIIGELGVLEYLYDYLKEKYKGMSPAERCNILHKRVGFAYMIVLGAYDDGFEFKAGVSPKILIDVKTYNTNKVTVSQIFNGLKDDKSNPRPLNLFIDANQTTKADIYIQTFISTRNKIILAGYNVGAPPVANWMPNRAHAKPVPDLEPIGNLPDYLHL